MAGRAILVALVCAISGLLLTVLASTKRLIPVLKKPCSVGSSSWSADTGPWKGSRSGGVAWRSVPNAAPNGHHPGEEKPWEEPRVASERSLGKERRHDPALTISVESLLKKHRIGEGVTLIDVRDRKAFEKCRIPGSINVPLWAVGSKTFLGSKFLILANNGFPSTDLEDRCRKLRDSGLLVWLLEGGLNAWREAGAPLEGELAVQNDLNRISPQDLLNAPKSVPWAAVDVRGAKPSNETLPFSKVISAGPLENEAGSITTLLDFQKREQRPSPRFFAVFNEDGAGYEKVEPMIRKAGIKSAFYLKGGLRGYNAFLTQSAAILQTYEHSGKSLGKCSGCQ